MEQNQVSLIERCALFRASLFERLHCTFIKNFCWCSGLFAYICDAYSETWRPYGPDHELKQCVVSCVTMTGPRNEWCMVSVSSAGPQTSLLSLSTDCRSSSCHRRHQGLHRTLRLFFNKTLLLWMLTLVNANFGRTHVVNTVSRQPWQITKVDSIGVFINFFRVRYFRVENESQQW